MKVAFDLAQQQKGKTLEVLVEGREEDLWVGRSYMDAPDIDTRVYFQGPESLAPGDFVWVAIDGARDYDLTGTYCAPEEGDGR